MPKRILLITNSYPSPDSPEKPFVLPEVRALLAAGHHVVLLPASLGSAMDDELPEPVTVERRLADGFQAGSWGAAGCTCLFRGFFWEELWAARRFLLGDGKHLRHFLKESLRAGAVQRLGRWLAGFDVVYSYWFCGEASGLVFSPHVKGQRIARVHGYDLYLERECNRGYIPYRKKAVAGLDRLVVLGDEARQYLLDRYELPAEKIFRSPLGVPKTAIVNPLPDRSVIRVVTCAYPRPVKRLSLVAQLVAALAERCRDQRVDWTHFGCTFAEAGFDRSLCLPPNVSCDFRGKVANRSVRDHYRSRPVHFIVNLSESEGMPVSIMEAMSYGIPVVATAVGGVPEMIDATCGILVDRTPEVELIASSLTELLADEARYQAMRAAALRRQQDCFDSEKNHAKFAAWIGSLDA